MVDKAGEWVEFTANFNFVPNAERRTAVAYKKGMRERVTAECAAAAIAAGKAVKSTDPRQDAK